MIEKLTWADKMRWKLYNKVIMQALNRIVACNNVIMVNHNKIEAIKAKYISHEAIECKKCKLTSFRRYFEHELNEKTGKLKLICPSCKHKNKATL